MSLLVTETSAMAFSSPAARRVSSRTASPISSGRLLPRAIATPRALGSLSTQARSKPRSCSSPQTRVPTLPSPTTMTWPPRGRGSPRIDPVSWAPTISAVTTGMSAMPSTVRITCEIFSGHILVVSVRADPVSDMIAR